MFEKQVETDRDGAFKSSESGVRQKLSVGEGGSGGAVAFSFFLYFFFFLIHLTLAARTLGPPQFVHLFINLSIATSPILRLHAQAVLLLLHEACLLLLSPLHLHADQVLRVQAGGGGVTVSVDDGGAVGPSHCAALLSVFDRGGVGRAVTDRGDVAAAVGGGRVGHGGALQGDLPRGDLGNAGRGGELFPAEREGKGRVKVSLRNVAAPRWPLQESLAPAYALAC